MCLCVSLCVFAQVDPRNVGPEQKLALWSGCLLIILNIKWLRSKSSLLPGFFSPLKTHMTQTSISWPDVFIMSPSQQTL